MPAPAAPALDGALVQTPEERVEYQQGHAAEQADPQQQVSFPFGGFQAAQSGVFPVIPIGVFEAVVYDAVGARVTRQMLEYAEPLVRGRLVARARVVLVVAVVLLAVAAAHPLAQVRALLL